MKFLIKRSFWTMLTLYMSIILVIVMVASNILEGYTKVINNTLGLTGYRIQTVNDGEEEELEYFKSKYVKKDANGNIIYETDESGYIHQVYDDDALRAAAINKAKQVQREGTTILWNSSDNGLPLSDGAKVSLFSQSTVSWGYSGGGSGAAYTGSNMRGAFTEAGLEVNRTLWDFYKNSGYSRVGMMTMNEVPWSAYTSEVKNSFATYGDAAIIVFTRLTREGSIGGASADVTQTGADTPTGDYLDLSPEEEEMVDQVIAAKKAGTFDKVIVLLNTPASIFMDSLVERQSDIDCCMWVGQTGTYGLDEVGNILVGKSIPSGHLADTFLYDTRSAPSYANSIATMYTNAKSMNLTSVDRQGVYLTYAENIYIGYKYYETRYEDAVLGRGNASTSTGAVHSTDGWVYAEEVAFPFGHGASYTSFEYSGYKVSENDDGNYIVSLNVKNTGNANGSDAVQIYVQKPYTEYDITWGIEQAAVNLAGYVKTPELEPGESVDLYITVRNDAFKTYDSNNKKTYIREAGDYYITVAEDAHKAINNILAAKGYTPDNTSGVMDGYGNEGLVKMFSFSDDDYESFSVSEKTGNPITNQFDDVDWNRYANKSEENVTYLSRNDWKGTYPTQVTKLSLNEKIVADLDYDHQAEHNPKDVFPLYGQDHTLNLIDLRGLEYNSPLWDTILDQLTFDEQIELLGNAYFGTIAMDSIAKPADVAVNGPLGVKSKYKGSGKSTVSYPSPTLLAASYNDQLAFEVGEMMGEEALHSGATGIYAPGANIHRSAYSSRNWEYLSEDGFLSGIIAKHEVMGIQTTGCYVTMKHFALNDQESYRHGVSVWVNEQALREIYLNAYEYAVTEGNATGMMSAFNRFGTKWSGAHKGLCTEVLRNEWGMKGLVLSDSAWQTYMGVIDGVMAGNDCILYNVPAAYYEQGKTNPTVAQAIRESTHRILYVIANSNAMNGFSSNTRIIEVEEWWQEAIEDVKAVAMVATGVLLLITILAFLLIRDDDSIFDGNPLVNAIETLVTFAVVGIIISSAISIPSTLMSWPEDYVGNIILSKDEIGEEEEKKPSLKEQLGEGYQDYKFEAEVSEVTSDKAVAGTEGKGEAATNYPSGGQFITAIKNATEFRSVFKITSSEDTTAVLSMCMGLREWKLVLSDVFIISVNGVEVDVDPDFAFPTYTTPGAQYFDWTEFEILLVELKEGENEIVFEKKEGLGDGVGNGLNFDYISLASTATLEWTHEVGVGHNYGDWTLASTPTAETAGKILSVCSTCRDYKNVEIPAISETNGYTKVGEDVNGVYQKVTWSITIEGYTFTKTENVYPDGWADQKFEAECSDLTTNIKDAIGTDNKTIAEANYPSGGLLIKGMKNATTFKTEFHITSDQKTTAILKLCFGLREWEMIVKDVLTLTVNGEEVEISPNVICPIFSGKNKWFDWTEIEIAAINLKEGDNNIVIEKKAGLGDGVGYGLNFDYISIGSVANLQWTSEVVVGHSYKEWVVVTEPTLNTTGLAGSYCSTCRDYIEEDLPVISVENGYTKTSEDSDTSYGSAVWSYTKGDSTLNFTTRDYPENANKYIFEAEGAKTTGSAGMYYSATSGASNNFYLNKLSDGSWTITFNVGSNAACEALLLIRHGCDKEVNLAEGRTLTVNGRVVTLPEIIRPKSSETWQEYEVVVIELKMGKNDIILSSDGSPFAKNLDYIALISESQLVQYEAGNTHECKATSGVALASTCTESGLSAGLYCSVCYEVMEAQTIVSPLGHSDGNGDEKCDRCDAIVCKIHTAVVDPAVKESCTSSGLTEGSHCSVCGEILVAQTVIGALGHKDENSDNVCDNAPHAMVSNDAVMNKYPFNLQNGKNPFDPANAGNADGLTVINHSTYGMFYEKSCGKTFTVTIIASEAMNVDICLTAVTNRAGVTTATIKQILLNGSSEGVTLAAVTPIPQSANWNVANATDVRIATLSLREGRNVITITRDSGDATYNDQQNNYNVTGISIDAPAPVTLGTNVYSFTVAENNPFDKANGGNADGLNVVSHATYGKYYEASYGKTFTLTVTVAKDATVEFYILTTTRFAGISKTGSVTEILIDGKSDGVVRADGNVTNIGGWNTSLATKDLFATLTLPEGTHVITFTRADEVADANNFNIAGVAFKSTDAEIILGDKK